jgi:hypothetical protein
LSVFQVTEANGTNMRFLGTNLLVTLVAYAFTTFVYPGEATFLPRICLMWAAPTVGTLAAIILTRVSLALPAFGAAALAMSVVSGLYCVVFHVKAISETLQWFAIAYFLPGAILALVIALLAKFIVR